MPQAPVRHGAASNMRCTDGSVTACWWAGQPRAARTAPERVATFIFWPRRREIDRLAAHGIPFQVCRESATSRHCASCRDSLTHAIMRTVGSTSPSHRRTAPPRPAYGGDLVAGRALMGWWDCGDLTTECRVSTRAPAALNQRGPPQRTFHGTLTYATGGWARKCAFDSLLICQRGRATVNWLVRRRPPEDFRPSKTFPSALPRVTTTNCRRSRRIWRPLRRLMVRWREVVLMVYSGSPHRRCRALVQLAQWQEIPG